MESLKTYGDWVSLIEDIDYCDDSTYGLLASGTFEEGAASRMFNLVQGYCSRCVNKLTASLIEMLNRLEFSDIDGAVVVIKRYSASCKRLLFFESIEGFPSEGEQLAAEIREYTRTVFRKLKADYEQQGTIPGDEMAYQMTKRLREWE